MTVQEAKLKTKIAKKKLAIVKQEVDIEKYSKNLEEGRLKILSKANVVLAEGLKKTYEKDLAELESKLKKMQEGTQ